MVIQSERRSRSATASARFCPSIRSFISEKKIPRPTLGEEGLDLNSAVEEFENRLIEFYPEKSADIMSARNERTPPRLTERARVGLRPSSLRSSCPPCTRNRVASSLSPSG